MIIVTGADLSKMPGGTGMGAIFVFIGCAFYGIIVYGVAFALCVAIYNPLQPRNIFLLTLVQLAATVLLYYLTNGVCS